MRQELGAFVSEVFVSVTRSDQREKGLLYLRGLMLEGRRKSMKQFVTSSPRKVEPVRRKIAAKAMEAIGPEAWVVDDTGFPKDGPASAGVARQYSGSLGKVGNVQIGVSIHAVTDAASCPLDWRLFIPQSWDDIHAETNRDAQQIPLKRSRAQIPEAVRHRPKWELAIEMFDELATWGQVPPVVVADAGHGEIGPFRTELTDRGIAYVVQVKSATSVDDADAVFTTPAPTGKKGRLASKASYRSAPVQAKDYATALAPGAFQEVSWRQGTKGVISSRFAAARVRPANCNLPKKPDG